MQDVETMRAQGLGLGGSLDNAIVMDDFRVLNSEGLATTTNSSSTRCWTRSAISTCSGHPLIGAFTTFKTGHALNNQLTRAVLARRESYELVTFDTPGEVPSAFKDWQFATA